MGAHHPQSRDSQRRISRLVAADQGQDVYKRQPNALILAAVNTVLLRILLENRTLMKMVKK